jgi:putative redox protein
MEQLSVRYLDGVKFEASCRTHKVIADQPRSAGGGDAGMTPPELLLASLGTCAAYYAAYYLRAHGLSTEGLEVKVNAGKVQGPPRLDNFTIHVSAPAVEESRHDALLRTVEKCFIHATLSSTPSIRTTVETADIHLAR